MMNNALLPIRSSLPKAIRRTSCRLIRSGPPSRLVSPIRQAFPASQSAFALRPFSSGAQTLSDVLARELAEETEEGRDQIPEELAELKSSIEKDWKVVDDGAITRLIRSIGASKVVVSFHCQDTVDGAEDYVEEEEGEEPALPFRFEILVSKAGNTLVLNCISNAGETTVDGVAMTTEDIESVQANGIGRNNYQGPEFQELAEDLQEALHEYVFSELGIDEDVSAFVSMYADYKEQVQYIGFLTNVSKVLP
ncbi:expressed unknown protein [Seminavis robusta]|uniref:Uncharacterized protein n=1 Tax=Seminavis robusta TaxID=568900 RepID=A0A9N8E885_9STRA|nr:expressed unknown protein [Seminavis robusta]|eukprot:Sro762_g198670.1 n/a (251) ;mRNA; f:14883-15635